MTAMPLYEEVAGDTPLLISFPHSGTFMPPDLLARLQPEVRDLPDTDWFVPELYAAQQGLGASLLRATHSRYVVDLNRPADGAPLYPGQRETTVCPLESFDGQALYAAGAEPGRAEIEQRIAEYWQPYHQRLAELSASIARRHGYCVLWDAHSIRSTVPGLFAGRLPDLNVGTADGRSCSPARAARIAADLAQQTHFSWVVNGRFKGGYITRHYGNPRAGVDAIQLEIAQAAYLEESRTPIYDPSRAEALRQVIAQLLQTVLSKPGTAS
jgi:N-formylglutamate deformylase